jgi:glycosyltransferase involved in cell wall biosynthesis
MEKQIAFVIPAHNEAGAIARVVREAKERIPGSTVYVCDNASGDATAAEAAESGARVLVESRRGKGMAVRRLLRDVEADIYILIDGDNTYDMSFLPAAVRKFQRGSYDLMTGNRFADPFSSSMRQGHGIANAVFTVLLRHIFAIQTRDLFSGLRIMSRRFVKSFPMISNEFEVETEISTYAARMQVPSEDFPTAVQARIGTTSKLNSIQDGLKITWFIIRLMHREHPLMLYFSLGAIIFAASTIGIISVAIEFLHTARVDRMPTFVLSVSGLVASLVLLIAGLILKEVVNMKYEARMLSYLSYECSSTTL